MTSEQKQLNTTSLVAWSTSSTYSSDRPSAHAISAPPPLKSWASTRQATAPAAPGGKPRGGGGRRRHDAQDREDRQALLDSAPNEEEEEEEEEGTEADQWNDADFEVIEMDDAPSLVTSPAAANTSPPPHMAKSPPPVAKATPPPGAASYSDAVPLLPDSSPRRLKLPSPAREKRD